MNIYEISQKYILESKRILSYKNDVYYSNDKKETHFFIEHKISEKLRKSLLLTKKITHEEFESYSFIMQHLRDFVAKIKDDVNKNIKNDINNYNYHYLKINKYSDEIYETYFSSHKLYQYLKENPQDFLFLICDINNAFLSNNNNDWLDFRSISINNLKDLYSKVKDNSIDLFSLSGESIIFNHIKYNFIELDLIKKIKPSNYMDAIIGLDIINSKNLMDLAHRKELSSKIVRSLFFKSEFRETKKKKPESILINSELLTYSFKQGKYGRGFKSVFLDLNLKDSKHRPGLVILSKNSDPKSKTGHNEIKKIEQLEKWGYLKVIFVEKKMFNFQKNDFENLSELIEKIKRILLTNDFDLKEFEKKKNTFSKIKKEFKKAGLIERIFFRNQRAFKNISKYIELYNHKYLRETPFKKLAVNEYLKCMLELKDINKMEDFFAKHKKDSSMIDSKNNCLTESGSEYYELLNFA